MKALVLSLVIAFSGSIASATCALSQAGLLQNTNEPQEVHAQPVKQSTHVAQSGGAGSTNAGNADIGN